MADGAGPSAEAIVLHSSWIRLIGSAVGTAMLVLAGVVLGPSGAPIGIKVGVGSFAVLMVLALLFDMPVASEFDSTGVTRRNLLRHHRLAWADIDRLKRTRAGGPLSSSFRKRQGGLMAKVGFRHYLLVDQLESRREFDQVRRVIGTDLADALGLGPDLAPPHTRRPTWRYRRGKWRTP